MTTTMIEKAENGGKLIKRSLAIAGHKTSVALEREFWTALEREAAHQGKSLAAVVAEIDATRIRATPRRSLASAIRVWLLGRSRVNGPIL